MSTRKIELSVGAIKIGDKHDIFTEEEFDYIKNKVPELEERVDIVEDELEKSLKFEVVGEGSIQLYVDKKKEIKGYPITSPDRVIDENGVSIKERLDGVETGIKDTYSNSLRKFKPTFAFNCIGSPCCDSKTYEEQKKLIDDMISIGVEEVSLCIYIKEETDGTMADYDDDDYIDQSIAYCKSNNIKISKLHLYVDQEFNTVTSNFKVNYTNMVRRILEKHNDIDYEYFVVWNEATTRVRGNTVKDTLLECMDIVKGYGKKVGIALMGVSPLFYVPSELIEKSDFIGFNHYQSIGNKKEKTTIADSIYAWENKGLLDMVNMASRKYPDKEILLTESGIIGSYDCLMSPAALSRSWFTYDFNGHVTELYYGGMLEALKDNTSIKKIYGWFPHDFVKYPDKMRNLFNEYLYGGLR